MILIRYGDTGYKWGTFIGRTDVPLVDGAIQNARKLGERLRGEGIKALYSSRMKRAMDTAEGIGKALNIRVSGRFRELNEIDFGKWETMTMDYVRKKEPGLLEERIKGVWDFKGHGGESCSELKNRALPAIMDLFRKHEGETFAVVSHGTLIKIMISDLTGEPLGSGRGTKLEFLAALFFKKDGDKIELEKEWGVIDKCLPAKH